MRMTPLIQPSVFTSGSLAVHFSFYLIEISIRIHSNQFKSQRTMT